MYVVYLNAHIPTDKKPHAKYRIAVAVDLSKKSQTPSSSIFEYMLYVYMTWLNLAVWVISYCLHLHMFAFACSIISFLSLNARVCLCYISFLGVPTLLKSYMHLRFCKLFSSPHCTHRESRDPRAIYSLTSNTSSSPSTSRRDTITFSFTYA